MVPAPDQARDGLPIRNVCPADDTLPAQDTASASTSDVFFDTSSMLSKSAADPPVVIDVHDAPPSVGKPDSGPRAASPILWAGGADFSSCSISLLKTILGAGLLAMPAAMATVGWLGGTVLIVGSALLAQLGLVALARCGERLGRGTSISSIAKVAHPGLARLIDAALVLKCFGVAVSYLVVIGDMVPSIAAACGTQHPLLLSRAFWICAAMGLVGPLAFLRNLDSLKYTSLAGLGAVVYMCAVAAANYGAAPALPPGSGPVALAPPSAAALKHFSIFIFAFTAHQNICTIQSEAAIPTAAFMTRVIRWSVGLSAAAYAAFSVICYATYGATTLSNVFLNFPAFRLEMVAGRLLYTLLSAFSYPLLTHPCRASLLNLLPLGEGAKLRHAGSLHRATTAAIVAGSLAAALALHDLGTISALIGTFIGIPICYIVPGLLYARLTAHEAGPVPLRRACLAMAGFGTAAMLVSVIGLAY